MTESMADSPNKANNWPEITELEKLDAEEFASRFPFFRTVLPYDPQELEAWYETEDYRKELEALIIKRISEAPIAASLCQVLTAPVTTKEDYFWLCCVGWLIGSISLEQFEPFRSAVVALSECDISSAPDGMSLISIQSHAKEMLFFMDNPDVAYVATRKTDSMFERSLNERVHSAEEMKPFVDDLLAWLADLNWPTSEPCTRQLARFPEATIDGIIDALEHGNNDPEWQQHIIEFAREHIPKGPMWERLAPFVGKQINSGADNEDEQALSEAAESWVNEWNKWKAQQVN